MAYIGNKPTVGNFQICDAISVVNGQAAYTMQVGSVNVIPQSSNHMIVSLNGTIQKPGGANPSFTVSGSTITFASNLVTNDVIDFIQILGDVLDLGVPSDATVTAAKLNNDIISGSTELASEPADTDEFLVSDAGTLKRIDYSLIKGGGITVADQWRLTSNKSNVGTSDTTIDSNLERIDTSGQNTIGTAMSESSGVFTFPSTGVYYVRADMVFTKDASRRAVYVTIRSGSTDLSQSYSHINPPTGDDAFASVSASTYFNVGNTTNDTIYFRGTNVGGGDVNALGSTTKNLTTFTFIRLGDN